MTTVIDEICAIARRAPSPNTGWASMCERAVAARVEPVRDLDLAGDALDLRGILVELRRQRRIPRGTDTLCFEIGERAGEKRRRESTLAVSGKRGDARVWIPDDAEVVLEALNAVYRAGLAARGAAAREGWLALRLGATGLVARFAAEDLRQRVAVGFAGAVLVEVARGKKIHGKGAR